MLGTLLLQLETRLDIPYKRKRKNNITLGLISCLISLRNDAWKSFFIICGEKPWAKCGDEIQRKKISLRVFGDLKTLVSASLFRREKSRSAKKNNRNVFFRKKRKTFPAWFTKLQPVFHFCSFFVQTSSNHLLSVVHSFVKHNFIYLNIRKTSMLVQN